MPDSPFLRFALVGGTATAIHYALALAIVWAGLAGVVVASSIGFMVSAVCNYLLNAHFTFGAAPLDAAQAWRFAWTVASGCALNAGLLHVFLQGGIGAVPSQLLATAGVLGWNFTLSSRWVFRRRS